jgi:hypothetical protein
MNPQEALSTNTKIKLLYHGEKSSHSEFEG